ncbi:type I-U CRISPR-associated protein Csb2 [Kineosporia sp. NBRC 101731]|uniref:type I-G CRISPR-associated protein Csb2 n=1 Tax=Kineosporia sp. NBRC 101731 TaxID=3032199 RepID=UPI0024A35AB9|nr:type I-U CRISPR-associated protein Csb2 [Kineosporia sp. NBRC 101731]GLY28096.1 hypothetical protein Kisp02_14610 [Kineosporia sp. NBRC 101731]
MSTTVAVRFTLGRYHATPWNAHVNEGQVELPPAPWRILRALYAVWKERQPQLNEQVVHELLAELADPPEYLVPEHFIAHTRHYYPDRASSSDKKSTDRTLDAFAAIDPREPLLITWPVDLKPEHHQALVTLCESLPYLGRADSLCTAEVLNKAAEAQGELWVPEETLAHDTDLTHTDEKHLLAPEQPLNIDSLTTRIINHRTKGLLYPADSRQISYRNAPPDTSRAPAPQTGAAPTNPAITVVRFHVAEPGRPAYLDTALITDLLHAAAAKKLDGVREKDHPSNLLGLDKEGKPLKGTHQHAHILTVPDAHRRIAQIIVWSPGGLADDEVKALTRIRKLFSHQNARLRRPTEVLVTAVGGNELLPPEWTGTSRTWISSTPYIPTGHSKNDPVRHALKRLRTDLNYVAPGLGDSIKDVSLISRSTTTPDNERPAVMGVYQRLPQRRQRGPHVDAQYLRVEFTDDITPAQQGLLVAGQLSHYGMGLFRPLPR